jgi:hypothetical protein
MPAALVKPVPAAADPEPPIPIDVEELPPESKPSGIGQKYVPKDEGAPPVILGEDVRAAEYGATNTEAEHRTRRAPTIAKMRAIDLPLPPPSEPDFAQPKRRSTSVVALLAVLVVAGGAGAAALLVRGGPAETATRALEPKAPAPVTADTAAPKPPEPVAAATPPATTPPDGVPTPSPEAGASGPVAVADKSPEPPAAKAPSKANAKAGQKAPAASPKPTPAAKAPAPTPTPKPAKPAASRPGTGSSKAAIVRDSPF